MHNENKCGTCWFYEERECYANPPTVVARDVPYESLRPKVMDTDLSCRFFKRVTPDEPN